MHSISKIKIIRKSMNHPHLPHILKPISKAPKSTTNLLSRLKKNKIPSSILSSVKDLSHPTPDQIRKLDFQKSVSCKCMNTLAKMQNL